jgi:hypothetical protein
VNAQIAKGDYPLIILAFDEARSGRNTLCYVVKLKQYETRAACFVSLPFVLSFSVYDGQGIAIHIVRR